MRDFAIAVSIVGGLWFVILGGAILMRLIRNAISARRIRRELESYYDELADDVRIHWGSINERAGGEPPTAEQIIEDIRRFKELQGRMMHGPR